MNSKETEELVDQILDNNKELTAKTGDEEISVESTADATSEQEEVVDRSEYLNRSGRRYYFSLMRKGKKRGPNFTKPKKRK
jgi:hypothetical protein